MPSLKWCTKCIYFRENVPRSQKSKQIQLADVSDDSVIILLIKRKVICKSGKKEGVVFMHGTITLCPFARKLANLITL